jgi:hypothetical protein
MKSILVPLDNYYKTEEELFNHFVDLSTISNNNICDVTSNANRRHVPVGWETKNNNKTIDLHGIVYIAIITCISESIFY